MLRSTEEAADRQIEQRSPQEADRQSALYTASKSAGSPPADVIKMWISDCTSVPLPLIRIHPKGCNMTGTGYSDHSSSAARPKMIIM